MKKIVGLLVALSFMQACKKEPKAAQAETETNVEITTSQNSEYVFFGEKITDENAVQITEFAEKYSSMSVGDSLPVKLIGKVDAVCQAKGCWMKLDMGDGEKVMVKFKDYAFFVPMNIAGQEVVIDGKAFLDEVSVDELKHYASDAGKSEEQIEAITAPERSYSFIADGVLINQ
ncbi:DUF4920 domain-containing protein [Mangrovimonas aestuarii]|uniref:DUF4920 domain-containing protein n=1 Tax=Mangrovimonas aestuarii TaxID=3018443 RepID=UPI00237A031A|nr:DUF4920 domain-containing protein [Mangrovimonas aestuarii]